MRNIEIDDEVLTPPFPETNSFGTMNFKLKGWIKILRIILTGYIESALSQAEFDKLEDGSFYGRIPSCKGVIAFGKTLRDCEDELRSALEDWVLVGLKLGHPIPVLGVIIKCCVWKQKRRILY